MKRKWMHACIALAIALLGLTSCESSSPATPAPVPQNTGAPTTQAMASLPPATSTTVPPSPVLPSATHAPTETQVPATDTSAPPPAPTIAQHPSPPPDAGFRQTGPPMVVPKKTAVIINTPAPVTTAVLTSPPAMPAGLDKIQHFIFIMQENRSFDEYFGTYPGADGLPPGVCVPDPKGGPCVPPYHDTLDDNRGGPHAWDDSAADVDKGKMDGFISRAYTGYNDPSIAPCMPAQQPCSPMHNPHDVMGYHDYNEIPNYWNYAHEYVLQDHMFESVATYSLSAHLYMLAAQSGGYVARNQPVPTEYDFPEITELFASGKVSWKYYVTSGSEPDTEDGHVLGNSIEQEQNPDKYSLWNPLPAFPKVQNDPSQRSRLVDTAQFYTDARDGTLPQVSWVVPSGAVSEHPPSGVREGMAYVTGLINAVMQGPDWSTSAIFVAWDDWGGFYDHVVPPQVDQYGFGIRVPSFVVGPYVKEGYIDKKTYSFESWLRIVEERYAITPMTSRDTQAADMLDAFDFTQKPRGPIILAATTQGSQYPQPLQPVQH